MPMLDLSDQLGRSSPLTLRRLSHRHRWSHSGSCFVEAYVENETTKHRISLVLHSKSDSRSGHVKS